MRQTIFCSIILITISFLTGCKKDTEIDIRDGYGATYIVTETWKDNSVSLTKSNFSMTIEKATLQDNMVLLNNFANYGSGVTAEATIEGKKLIITEQTLPNLKVIAGTGTFTDTTLVFDYTETFNSVSIEISSTGKKK